MSPTKGFWRKTLSVLLTLSLFAVPGLARAGVSSDGHIVVGGTHVTDYYPDSLETNHVGGYNLEHEITSGLRDAYDTASTGGKVTTEDSVAINKTAAPLDSFGNTILTLTVDVKNPAQFNYYPPPRIDYVFVLDVTSSMLQPLRDNLQGESTFEALWDSRTRISKMRTAVKAASQHIWDSNPNSTITIIPFGNDAFTPRVTGDGFDYGGNTSLYNITGTDSGTFSTVTVPSWQPTASQYSNLTQNQELTSQFNYYTITKPADDTAQARFEQSIDALPLVSNTNTSAGMNEALNVLESGDLAATQQLNRNVFLITDGAANWPWDTYAYPSAYLNYEYQLNTRVNDLCTAIKDPGQGNAIVSVVSIDPQPVSFENYNPNNTGSIVTYDDNGAMIYTATGEPYDGTNPLVIDAQAGMRYKWATSSAHYFGTGVEAAEGAIDTAVRESTALSAGFNVTLHDAVDDEYYEMIGGTVDDVDVAVEYEGTTYHLDDVGSPVTRDNITVENGRLEIDFGTMPFGDFLGNNSNSHITITYAEHLRSDIGVHEPHLHTNVDDETYLEVAPPHHAVASSNDVVYDTEEFYMPFPTPYMVLDEDFATLDLAKVDENLQPLAGSTFKLSTEGYADFFTSPDPAQLDALILPLSSVIEITETAAPEGYKPLPDTIEITVDEQGAITMTGGASDKVNFTIDPSDPTHASLAVVNERTGGGGEVPVQPTPTPASTTPSSSSGKGPSTGDDGTNAAIALAVAGLLGGVMVLAVLDRRYATKR